MPTGFTADILKGKITTLEQFAKLCVRGMGAAVHMRDEPIDKPYEPRIPSTYHLEDTNVTKKELKALSKITNEQLIAEHKKNIKLNLKYYKERVDECVKNGVILNKMLEEIKAWVPPTSEHDGFKTFMKEQIESTINYDADASYSQNEVDRLEKELDSDVDGADLREEKILYLTEKIDNSKMRQNKETEGCKENNKWVEDLYESLNK